MTANPSLIDTVAYEINEAGNDWLRSNPKAGWGDIPDKVFARAALQALLEAGPTEAMRGALSTFSTLDDGRFWGAFDTVLRAALEEADR